MIDFITLKNFRAFKEQTFRFKKLNIFIGKNNSGKSSALSAINLIAQTMQNQEVDASPLMLNGPFDQLGTYIDVVNGNNPRRRIGFEIGFDDYVVKTEYKYRTQRRQTDLTSFELLKSGNSILRYIERKDSYDMFLGGEPFEKIAPNLKKRKPKFRNFWPLTNFRIEFSRSSSKFEEEKFVKLLKFEQEMLRARRYLIECFDRFDSVSPFRDQPQRTYLYSGETASRVGITGSNMATILAEDAARRGVNKGELIGKISEWFKYTGIAKGLSIDTLTSRHYEISLTSNDGTKHNICDVGFGCSQVLPVLVAGLNLFATNRALRGSRTLVVQEPEIHLHPDAQAAMGSFFVSLAAEGNQMFVETHSDNLVLRIARHVALGDIEADDVAIFFIADQLDKRVTEIEVNASGAFVPEWPNGFFPQRQTESLLLARAAMTRREGAQQQLPFKYPDSQS